MSEEITVEGSEAAAGITLEQLREVVETATAASEQRTAASVDAKLDELRTPDRSDVPEYVNRNGEKVTKLRNVSERRYAKLSPELQEVRDDESDHWGAKYIRALATSDRAGMAEASDKIETYFGRATVLEGAGSTSGALSDGSGAGLLPINLIGTVQIAIDNAAIGRNIFRIENCGSQNQRLVTIGAATAAMAAEGATAAQGEPAFATKTLIPKKLQCFFKASTEQLADSAFDLVSTFSNRAGMAIGEREDIEIATSSGTAPSIQESLDGTAYTEASSAVLQYEDLVGMFMAIDQAQRRGACWLGGAAMLTFIGQMLDGNGHPQVLFPGALPEAITNNGGVGMILNRPVYEFPIPAGELWFGNPQNAYAMGIRQGVVASVSEHVDFASDLVNFKFTERFDGVNLDTDGAASLVSGITSVG